MKALNKAFGSLFMLVGALLGVGKTRVIVVPDDVYPARR